MEIRVLDISEKKKLEDFLVFNNGQKHRAMAQAYIQSMFSEDYRRPCFFVVFDNSEIIGAAAISEELFTTNMWGISWVSVHIDHRNKGIGEKLVHTCLEEIEKRTENKVTVILDTYPDKTGLYKKTGFEVIGHDCHGGSLMVKHVGIGV